MVDEQRVIELRPEAVPGQRWDGYLTSDPPEQQRHWCGGSCEQVEHMMTDDLGPLPADQKYQIVEGGWR